MPRIRTANSSDAENLADLAETTFRDTFSAYNTVADMTMHCQSNYGPDIQAREIADLGYATLVAEVDDRLVAYAQLRWLDAPSCVPAVSPGEIHRLYVAREWHGRGLAQVLMNECLEQLSEHDRDMAWLGVWEHNPRAISFYRKFAFREVGDHIFPVGRDPQRDIIMVRPLSPTGH